MYCSCLGRLLKRLETTDPVCLTCVCNGYIDVDSSSDMDTASDDSDDSDSAHDREEPAGPFMDEEGYEDPKHKHFAKDRGRASGMHMQHWCACFDPRYITLYL